MADLRYSFTASYLWGSAIFATHAHNIERDNPDTVSDDVRAEHRSYVSSTVFQCAAALEAEIFEILHYGPGHHLGSNGIDVKSRDFLKPLEDLKRDHATLFIYDLVLHILKKHSIRGHINEKAVYLFGLRNELLHYKSLWGSEMDRKKFFQKLQNQLRLEKPPFVFKNANFFPDKCLSASLASWCVRAAVDYINEFYEKIEVKSPLKAYEQRIIVPDPRTI